MLRSITGVGDARLMRRRRSKTTGDNPRSFIFCHMELVFSGPLPLSAVKFLIMRVRSYAVDTSMELRGALQKQMQLSQESLPILHQLSNLRASLT